MNRANPSRRVVWGGRLRTLAGLSGGDLRRLGEATWLLGRTSVRLRRTSWPEASRDLLRTHGRPDPREGQAVIRSVEMAAVVLPWHPTCLPQALTVQQMLHRRQVGGHIEFDMPDPVAGRPGHARVELD